MAAIVGQPVEVEGHTVRVEASIGPEPGRLVYARSDRVLRDADIAMYDAKARGGRRTPSSRSRCARDGRYVSPAPFVPYAE